MVKNLRPREAAQALGIGLSTFWLKAKTDPDFPQLISLGPKSTVVREADLEAYVEKKASKGREQAGTYIPKVRARPRRSTAKS
jgi:predicted DNA-binding transcriptional regulator AlpA